MKQQAQNGFIVLTGTFLVSNANVLSSTLMLVCTLSKRYTHTVIIQTIAVQAVYSTCIITHAIITKQYAVSFYGQHNRCEYQKEKEGKIWHLKASCERQSSQCKSLRPPRSEGMSCYPVFLHIILPLLTIYYCLSACAGSCACQTLWLSRFSSLIRQNYSLLLLNNVENAHRRVYQVQEQTKECMVRSSKMKQDLPLLISASSSLLSLTASAVPCNFTITMPYKVCNVPSKALHTEEKKTLRILSLCFLTRTSPSTGFSWQNLLLPA